MIKKSAFYLLPWLLLACQTAPTPENVPAIHPERWQLRGKISLSFPDCRQEDCPIKTQQGQLDWQHRGQLERLIFSDPFGREHARLIHDGERIRYRDAQGEQNLPASELAQVLGVDLPLSGLAQGITQRDALPPPLQQWTRRGWRGNHYQSLSLQQGDWSMKLFVQSIQNLAEDE